MSLVAHIEEVLGRFRVSFPLIFYYCNFFSLTGRFCEQDEKESYNQTTETYNPRYVVKFVNIGDHKRRFRQQAWTRKRKKRLKVSFFSPYLEEVFKRDDFA